MASGRGRQAARAPDRSTEDALDDLFRRPLGDFTAARNELAATLKQHGMASAAEQVKGLAKPPISAWAVNQLYFEDRNAFDRMLAVGEQTRAAQAAQLAGQHVDTRALLAARREALAALADRASRILRDAGHAGSLDTLRRVTATLEALATYGESPGAPKPGRLTADLDPPGFEALAALIAQPGKHSAKRSAGKQAMPAAEPKPAAARPDNKDEARAERARRAAREAQLREALQAAQRALKDAKRDASAAQDEMKALAGRAKETEKRRADLEAQLEKATSEADDARARASEAASRADHAAQAVRDAEARVQRAREAVDRP